jgi:multicomponent Na+:H+ antiporter subunit F
MSSSVLFLIGIAWLAVLLLVIVVFLARSRTTAERLVALDLAVLVLVGLLGLVAEQDQRSYPLDAALALALLSFVATLAAARYLGDRRPFDQPEEDLGE